VGAIFFCLKSFRRFLKKKNYFFRLQEILFLININLTQVHDIPERVENVNIPKKEEYIKKNKKN